MAWMVYGRPTSMVHAMYRRMQPWCLKWTELVAGDGSTWMGVSKKEQDQKVLELLQWRFAYASQGGREEIEAYLPSLGSDLCKVMKETVIAFANGLNLACERPQATPFKSV